MSIHCRKPLFNTDPIGGNDGIGATDPSAALDVRVHERGGRQAQSRKVIVIVIVAGLEVVVITL